MNSIGSQVKAYFEDPESYLKKDFNLRIRAHLVQRLLGEVRNSRVLDLGCGDGSISSYLLSYGNKLTLLDFSSAMLQRAKAAIPREFHGQVEFVQSDLLSYACSNRYDVVLCIGVLAHVPSLEATLHKVSSLVRPGGRCVIQITDGDQWLGKFHHMLSSARRLFQRKRRHNYQRTTLSQLSEAALKNDLIFHSLCRHSLLLPGMSVLPNPWLYRYEKFVSNYDSLAKHGTDVILLYEKDGRSLKSSR